MKRTFQYRQSNLRRETVIVALTNECRRRSQAGEDFDVTVSEPKRTVDMNSAMWATMADIAAQVEWPHTNNKGEWVIALMDSSAWKAVLSSGFERETTMAQGIGGGTVMVGARTSQYSKRRMGELIDFIQAFGAERGVRWSARAQDEMLAFQQQTTVGELGMPKS